MKKLIDTKIAIIGLGYVGLPLAVEFAKKYSVVGYDINKKRIDELNSYFDKTLETSEEDLRSVMGVSSKNHSGLVLTDEKSLLQDCDVYVVTVPTPTDKNNRPLLDPLYKASNVVGQFLSPGNIVVYESTVYPGVTEDECAPILEKVSGLKLNKDFFVGYSPERINPGDKLHTVTKILKITSGSTIESASFIDSLYNSIIEAGTYKAQSIKVAEAAKVIENSQRDINIAFVNELSKIFNLLEIDTNDVLDAASTKWNFLNFRPGLVGGHCIGVDPYYLAQKAQESGYHPEIILAGRRTNDEMGKYVSSETVKLMIKKGINIRESNILILGFTFKENCPDFRNTKVIDIINDLLTYNLNVEVYDPWLETSDVGDEYSIQLLPSIPSDFGKYQAIILAVGHDKFKELNFTKKSNRVIFDVKSFFDKNIVDGRL
jgi:UDP-N-acetyl-D-galactosamine dehydrogenase